MNYLMKNDLGRVEGGAPVRVGNQSNANRESKIYIMNIKENGEAEYAQT